MGQVWKFINKVLSQLLNIFKKAHYHEYPILDDDGKVVGHEIVTTRGGYTTSPVRKTNEMDNEEN